MGRMTNIKERSAGSDGGVRTSIIPGPLITATDT